MKPEKFDVVIIGGGPSGSTCGGFLKKHNPDLKVCILEREVFPRDHIGESQLPLIGQILNELGVWDRIEAAGFPIKIGGTYRWGTTDNLWDFDFLPYGKFEDEQRPAKYAGQRKLTAFQVDRSVYDKILLDYAEELGCEVRYQHVVRKIENESGRVQKLVLHDGQEIEADWYVDATGHVGIMRRALGIHTDEPSTLKNIAGWDYWRNAEWAVSLGIGGTRIQIMSLGYGWIWFIPIGPDRTSIGFVCPADYYKKSGMKHEDLYMRALSEEPRLQNLLKNAAREDRFEATKDWSFVAEKMCGENWILTGEAAGFADPILSAGMTLAHASAREAAFLILEAFRGGDVEWMGAQYTRRNERRVRQHIRFADYWYGANANFTDLKDYTSEIARDAGLDLNGDDAFRWLGTGGFIEEDMEVAGLALIRLDQLHSISGKLSAKPVSSSLDGYSRFDIDVSGSEKVKLARFENGGVKEFYAIRRKDRVLPVHGFFGFMVEGLFHSPYLNLAMQHCAKLMGQNGIPFNHETHSRLTECLEAMIRDGWVKAKLDPKSRPVNHKMPMETAAVHNHIPDYADELLQSEPVSSEK